MSDNKKYTFIDLFAGCGGLSDGFLQTEQFEGLAHVEWELPAHRFSLLSTHIWTTSSRRTYRAMANAGFDENDQLLLQKLMLDLTPISFMNSDDK